MLTGDTPFAGDGMEEIFDSIVNDEATYPEFISVEAVAIMSKLLCKHPGKRLGATESDAGDVKEQEFFRSVKWDDLLQKKIQPPFVPTVTSPEDVSNFDEVFTTQKPDLTLPTKRVLKGIDQMLFKDFDYIYN